MSCIHWNFECKALTQKIWLIEINFLIINWAFSTSFFFFWFWWENTFAQIFLFHFVMPKWKIFEQKSMWKQYLLYFYFKNFLISTKYSWLALATDCKSHTECNIIIIKYSIVCDSNVTGNYAKIYESWTKLKTKKTLA